MLASLPTLLLAFLPAPTPSDDPIDDFERYFERYDDAATRVEVVLALEGFESPRVVDALLPVLNDDDPRIVQAAVRVLGAFETRPPVERLLEELGERRPQEEVLGCLRAIAEGGYGGVLEAVVPHLDAGAWEVRRATLGALAASGDGRALPAVEERCSDGEPAVRCAALEALAALDAERALPRGVAALEDRSWQVRACAMGVLGGIRSVETIPPLVARMEAEEGRLVEDAARALTRLTGRNFGLDAGAWRRFWDTFGADYRLPTPEELEERAARRLEQEAERYGREGLATFHGIQTPSHAIVFVIDVSGTMEQEVVHPAREPEGDGEEPLTRLELVQRELVRAIEELASYAEFNVLAYATEIDPWKRSLVPASRAHKADAKRWVERLRPLGGTSEYQHVYSRTERVPPGAAANLLDLEIGKTNTYGALMRALEAAGRGTHDRHYEVAVDTIFLLSDGMPTYGEVVAPHDILREVRRVNGLRRVVIHTVAIGQFNKGFMQELAEQNGGRFVDLGW